MVIIKINENDPKIEEKKVRKHFDEVSQKWQFSIVDIIGLCTPSSDPRNYWKVLKNRLKKGQNELVTSCNQLKLTASDGKLYLTDVADTDTILALLSNIPNVKVEAFQAFLLHLGAPVPEVKKVIIPLDEIPEISNFDHTEGVESEAELLVDGYQTPSEIFIIAMVAGVLENSLQINLTSKKITISGEKRVGGSEPILKGGEYLYEELVWTTFSRTITLPASIDADKFEKVLENGKLAIRLIKII